MVLVGWLVVVSFLFFFTIIVSIATTTNISPSSWFYIRCSHIEKTTKTRQSVTLLLDFHSFRIHACHTHTYKSKEFNMNVVTVHVQISVYMLCVFVWVCCVLLSRSYLLPCISILTCWWKPTSGTRSNIAQEEVKPPVYFRLSPPAATATISTIVIIIII